MRRAPIRSSIRCPSGSASSTPLLHVWHLSPLFGEGMRFYNLAAVLYGHRAAQRAHRQPGRDRNRRLVGLLLHGVHHHPHHVPVADRLRHPRPRHPRGPLCRRPLRHLLDRGVVHHPLHHLRCLPGHGRHRARRRAALEAVAHDPADRSDRRQWGDLRRGGRRDWLEGRMECAARLAAVVSRPVAPARW